MLDAPPTGRITRFLDATREVAKLTKFGPINSQSEGVIKLLHGPQTAVHIVTLLEEMPVQETIDAAAELAVARVPAGRGDRQPGAPDPARRPIGDRTVDETQLAAGLELGRRRRRATRRRSPPRWPTTRSVSAVQETNAARLDALALPRIVLPDLNPPVELGELKDLARRFLARASA